MRNGCSVACRRKAFETAHITSDEAATGHAVYPGGSIRRKRDCVVRRGRIWPLRIPTWTSRSRPVHREIISCSRTRPAWWRRPSQGRTPGECGLSSIPRPWPPTSSRRPWNGLICLFSTKTEAEGLTGQSKQDEILATMRRRFPRAATVLTLGHRGAVYADATNNRITKRLSA
jgi:sugar/nucleoside kinase (ribokinase family)